MAIRLGQPVLLENVLEALDIIAKDKKSVSWRGFPDTHCSRDFLAQERATRRRARRTRLPSNTEGRYTLQHKSVRTSRRSDACHP